MKTCATCKHWDADSRFIYEDSLAVRVCNATPMLFDSCKWAEDGESRQFDPAVTATAFAQDGSDYTAHLYTKPEHGCTMHEDAP